MRSKGAGVITKSKGELINMAENNFSDLSQ